MSNHRNGNGIMENKMIINASITQNGVELDKSKYNWDENNLIFSTSENNLELIFSSYEGVTFKTGSNCNFKTGSYCIFITGGYCKFITGYSCVFNTGLRCMFDTGSDCTFKTGKDCIFEVGSYCTFSTGYNCIFAAEQNCVIIVHDQKGIIEIPSNKTIILDTQEIKGYTIL